MSADSYRDRVRQARRLALLQLLHRSAQYTAPDVILYQALPDESVAASLDQVRSEIAWLQDQGLVTAQPMGEVSTVRLTVQGLDVAEGRVTVPGVARALPGG